MLGNKVILARLSGEQGWKAIPSNLEAIAEQQDVTLSGSCSFRYSNYA
ncbi:hypothetical protein O9992_28070 [Vibrio lentus]|nr:hypothetical protein [Vibrio lentus]